MSEQDLYIGLMSGTSLDAVDAVLVDFSKQQPILLAKLQHPLPNTLKQELTALNSPGNNEIERAALADRELGVVFAQAVNSLLNIADINADQVRAIGSHGQTIRHAPTLGLGFTVQIGDPNTISQLTAITTVGDFRRRDIAAGGQGAPLVPLFHAAMLANSSENRVIVNIGGMANITLLPSDVSDDPLVGGFDTGPGNVLSDLWIKQYQGLDYDRDGQWASGGKLIASLLEELLNEPFFAEPAPKSTGRDLFNASWLQSILERDQIQAGQQPAPQDVQRTLVELTAQSICQAIRAHAPQGSAVYLCGGGSHNHFLVERLTDLLDNSSVGSTTDLGINADFLEAIAFAWLARRTMQGLTGNDPSATGAQQAVILGGVYPKN